MTHGRADARRTSRGGAGGEAPPSLDRRRWLALVVVLFAGFMDLLDVTIVNVAIPSILRDLQAEYAEIQWIVAGYVLGFAAVLITAGRLGDIFGRKRLFLIGMAGFTLASALCGLAASPAVLIGARFVQGAMAGVMVPQILAIIHATFGREERAKAYGLFGGIMGSASAAGLVIGGLLVQWNLAGLGWRPIFLVNVPVGLAAMVAAWFVIRESRSPTAPRLDLVGVVLALAAVLMLVYPLTEGRSLGWPIWAFLLMAGAVVLLVLLVAYELRRTRTVGSPLVVLSLFRARTFTAGILLWLIFGIAFAGFFLAWTLYMQVGLRWTPIHAGLTAVSFALGAMVASGLSVVVLTPRFGRRVLIAGALTNALGYAGYSWIASHYGPAVNSWQMLPPLVLAGIGFGLILAPMVDLILTDVPVRDAGSASGLLSTIQQLGMAFGVALVGVLFFTHLDNYSGRSVDAVVPGLQRQLAAAGVPESDRDTIVDDVRACVHERSAATDPAEIPPSCRTVLTQPRGLGQAGETREIISDALQLANAHNFSRTFSVTLWYAIGVLVVFFLGLFALPRHARPHDIDAELETRETHHVPDTARQ